MIETINIQCREKSTGRLLMYQNGCESIELAMALKIQWQAHFKQDTIISIHFIYS